LADAKKRGLHIEVVLDRRQKGAPPIELIDAEMLIDMMEKEEIGLKPKTVFDVDYTFFDQYM